MSNELLLRRRTMLAQGPKGFYFTVNSSGKKVEFSPGNLYWNGSKFAFEAHQYDYPTSWRTNHVGHFFYHKTASGASAASYSSSGRTTSDILFAANGGAIEGWTVLSKDEWQYLFDNALVKNSLGEYPIVIAGKKCAVFKPDGFNGTVADSYTASEWAQAEAEYSLVALPYSGYRSNLNIIENIGSRTSNWSCNPDPDNVANAYTPNVEDVPYILPGTRTSGRTIRLVKVV